jgi:hypothetical protein
MIDFTAALAYVYDCPTMPHALETFESARAALRCDARPVQERPGDSAGSEVSPAV